MEYYQKTLKKGVAFTGRGLHSSCFVNLEVIPAPADTGILFYRTDLNKREPIKASYENITSTMLSMTIGFKPNHVATIEHLMGAFIGVGIDNAIVKLNGPEVPIMDGSATPFVEAFLQIGLKKQPAPKKYLLVREPLKIQRGDQYIKIIPSYKQRIRCAITYQDKVIGSQSICYERDLCDFLKIAKARTFCHINDIAAMHRNRLALGGTLENAVVVTDTGILNRDGLRFQDEFVSHKLLDFIGDLSLLGGVLIGDIEISKPGHSFHSMIMEKLASRKDRYLAVVDAHYLNDMTIKQKVADEAGFSIGGGDFRCIWLKQFELGLRDVLRFSKPSFIEKIDYRFIPAKFTKLFKNF